MSEFKVGVRVGTMYVAYDEALDELFKQDPGKADRIIEGYRQRILNFTARGKRPFSDVQDTAGGFDVVLRHDVSIETLARLADELQLLFDQVIEEQFG